MHRDDLELLIDNLTRRRFLALGAAAASSAFMPLSAFALAGGAKSVMLGSTEVTIYSDGELTLPLAVLSPDATPEQLAEIARRLGWSDGNAHPQANIPVIRAGGDIIVVDNGSGDKFQPSAGKLMENLKAGGVDPASVTKVVFTHAHPDHIWGTLGAGDALVFPNAAYYVGGTEFDFWMNPDIFNQLPADFHGFAKGAQRDLGAVKDRITMVKAGDEIAPGIAVLETPGHTPGHISLEIAGGDGLIITGDAMPSEIISFENPGWRFGFDAIPEIAIKSRTELVGRAAAEKKMLLGYHWTYPGLGMAEAKDGAFRYVPAA